jgi:ribosomal protein L29
VRQSEVAKRSELFRLKFRALLVGASEQLAEAYIVKRRVASPLCPKDLLAQW